MRKAVSLTMPLCLCFAAVICVSAKKAPAEGVAPEKEVPAKVAKRPELPAWELTELMFMPKDTDLQEESGVAYESLKKREWVQEQQYSGALKPVSGFAAFPSAHLRYGGGAIPQWQADTRDNARKTILRAGVAEDQNELQRSFKEAETERWFDYQGEKLTYRVHKTSWVIWQDLRKADIPRDYFREGCPTPIHVGTLASPWRTRQGVKDVADYLHGIDGWGAVVRTTVYESKTHFHRLLYVVRHARGDWNMLDRFLVYMRKTEVAKDSGMILTSRKVLDMWKGTHKRGPSIAPKIGKTVVKVGATMTDVVKHYGQPQGRMKQGDKIMWKYPKGYIIFRDGVAVSCTWMTDAEFKAQQARRAAEAARRKRAALPDLVVPKVTVVSYSANSIKYKVTIKNIGKTGARLGGPTRGNRDDVIMQAYVSFDEAMKTGRRPAGGRVLQRGPTGEMLMPGESMVVDFSGSGVDPRTHPYLVVELKTAKAFKEARLDNNIGAVRIDPKIQPAPVPALIPKRVVKPKIQPAPPPSSTPAPTVRPRPFGDFVDKADIPSVSPAQNARALSNAVCKVTGWITINRMPRPIDELPPPPKPTSVRLVVSITNPGEQPFMLSKEKPCGMLRNGKDGFSRISLNWATAVSDERADARDKIKVLGECITDIKKGVKKDARRRDSWLRMTYIIGAQGTTTDQEILESANKHLAELHERLRNLRIYTMSGVVMPGLSMTLKTNITLPAGEGRSGGFVGALYGAYGESLRFTGGYKVSYVD